jgi:Tfp pilus assembly protein PilN
MRAVNLIPGESARGGGGTGPYALIGALVLVLLALLAYVLSHNTLVERRAQLASLQTQSQAMQTQAEIVRPYSEFARLAQARLQTVRQLGVTRFDWHRAFHDLATVLPDNVWLSSLLGTVTTGVSVEGASSGDTATLRAALPNPAIELSGCTTDQDSVARLISRLRLMSGVVRVSLATSVKAETSPGGAAPGDSGDCTHGHSSFPKFGIVVFFDQLPALPTAPTAGASTSGATAATQATPAASTTPAPSAAPSTGSNMR